MKAIPKIKDFKEDFDLYPIKGRGGVVDMNYVVRKVDVETRLEEAKVQWMLDAEQKIKDLKEELPNNPGIMNRDALILRIELANRILNKN